MIEQMEALLSQSASCATAAQRAREWPSLSQHFWQFLEIQVRLLASILTATVNASLCSAFYQRLEPMEDILYRNVGAVIDAREDARKRLSETRMERSQLEEMFDTVDSACTTFIKWQAHWHQCASREPLFDFYKDKFRDLITLVWTFSQAFAKVDWRFAQLVSTLGKKNNLPTPTFVLALAGPKRAKRRSFAS